MNCSASLTPLSLTSSDNLAVSAIMQTICSVCTLYPQPSQTYICHPRNPLSATLANLYLPPSLYFTPPPQHFIPPSQYFTPPPQHFIPLPQHYHTALLYATCKTATNNTLFHQTQAITLKLIYMMHSTL